MISPVDRSYRNLILYDVFFLKVCLNLHFDDIAFRLMSTKEQFALTNLCPSVEVLNVMSKRYSNKYIN